MSANNVYHGTRYFLEIIPPSEVEPGRDYPITIGVRSGVPPTCLGDCSGNAVVTIDELIRLVNIALDNQPITACGEGDRDFNRRVTIDELVTAVRAALEGCSGRDQESGTREQEIAIGGLGR